MPWFSAFALLFLTGIPLAAQCAIEIGTVADFKGTWTDLTYKHRLTRNEVVCGDSQLQRVNDASASATDFLKLARRSDSKQTVTFECRNLLGCGKPLDLRALVREEQQKLRGSGVLESFASWRDAHNSTVHTLSGRRGPTPATAVLLRTAIVEAGKPIPAVEVFRADAPAGNFQLDLCAQPTDEACGKTTPSPKVFSWRPGSGASLPFASPRAGLSILYRLKDDDPELRTNDHALVIAAAPSRVDRIAQAREKIAAAALSVSSGDAERAAAFEEYVRYVGEFLARR